MYTIKQMEERRKDAYAVNVAQHTHMEINRSDIENFHHFPFYGHTHLTAFEIAFLVDDDCYSPFLLFFITFRVPVLLLLVL